MSSRWRPKRAANEPFGVSSRLPLGRADPGGLRADAAPGLALGGSATARAALGQRALLRGVRPGAGAGRQGQAAALGGAAAARRGAGAVVPRRAAGAGAGAPDLRGPRGALRGAPPDVSWRGIVAGSLQDLDALCALAASLDWASADVAEAHRLAYAAWRAHGSAAPLLTELLAAREATVYVVEPAALVCLEAALLPGRPGTWPAPGEQLAMEHGEGGVALSRNEEAPGSRARNPSKMPQKPSKSH